MDFGSPEFVISLVALSMGAWIINTWIRAKHGYPLEDEWGGKTEKPDHGASRELAQQNRDLIEKMEAMQDRMIVLERIVTDRGYSVAQEIESLRDRADAKDSGVPLSLANKESA